MLVLSALLREGPLYSRTLSGASYYVVNCSTFLRKLNFEPHRISTMPRSPVAGLLDHYAQTHGSQVLRGF